MSGPRASIRFACIAADPPWSFSDRLPGVGRGAARNYNVMSSSDICALSLPPIADDAYLFLWRVSSQVEEAYRVVRAWGFVPKGEIVWQKLTGSGKHWFGMGRHVRASHETCIVAVRGKPTRLNANTRSTFAAPVGRHSEKPAEFYRLVEALCPGPRLELFARARRAGWVGIGDQMPSPVRMTVKGATSPREQRPNTAEVG